MSREQRSCASDSFAPALGAGPATSQAHEDQSSRPLLWDPNEPNESSCLGLGCCHLPQSRADTEPEVHHGLQHSFALRSLARASDRATAPNALPGSEGRSGTRRRRRGRSHANLSPCKRVLNMQGEPYSTWSKFGLGLGRGHSSESQNLRGHAAELCRPQTSRQ